MFIYQLHSGGWVCVSRLPGVEDEVPCAPGLPGGFVPLVSLRPVGKDQFQQVEGHGKRTMELPLHTVTGLAQPASYGIHTPMLAISTHNQGDRIPGCRSHEA